MQSLSRENNSFIYSRVKLSSSVSFKPKFSTLNLVHEFCFTSENKRFLEAHGRQGSYLNTFPELTYKK